MAIRKPGRGELFLRIYLGLLCFSIVGQTVSSLLRLNPGFVSPLAGCLTLLAALSATFYDFWTADRSAIARSLGLLVMGALVELGGILTGFPFGRYVYTDKWWPAIPLSGHGYFPILLPFAWLTVVGAATIAAGAVTKSMLSKAAFAGAAAVLLDFFLEGALAGRHGFWRWIDRGPGPGGAPLSNFVAWFALAFAGGLLLGGGPSKSPPRRNAWFVLGGQTLLMLIFNFV